MACGRNPDGCTWYPRAGFRNENRQDRPKSAKPLQNSGFCGLALNRLGVGNPLTAGPLEFRFWEFGSPNATLFITKNRELSGEFRQGLLRCGPSRPLG